MIRGFLKSLKKKSFFFFCWFSSFFIPVIYPSMQSSPSYTMSVIGEKFLLRSFVLQQTLYSRLYFGGIFTRNIHYNSISSCPKPLIIIIIKASYILVHMYSHVTKTGVGSYISVPAVKGYVL